MYGKRKRNAFTIFLNIKNKEYKYETKKMSTGEVVWEGIRHQVLAYKGSVPLGLGEETTGQETSNHPMVPPAHGLGGSVANKLNQRQLAIQARDNILDRSLITISWVAN